MKTLPILLLAATAVPSKADPQLTSWYTADSSQYARLYQSTADETAGTVSKTWSRGTGIQSSPTYAGVSKIAYSTSWVYIRATGLASHIMGPWYLDAAKTSNFPNFPSNNAKIYRIPRVPSVPASKTLTGLGATGCMVNGVSMFDSRDAFSYVSASSTDATPVNGLTGYGVWNRDGYHNENVTFDPAFAHQAGNNYHYHAQPIGLRYQLGDHVNYNSTTNRYTESTAAVTAHSPILAWAADGFPVYGPYGYSSPLDPNSGVRRMVSGHVLRNGSYGTTNLTSTGRTTLPPWAQRIQTVAFKNGPGVSTTYALGHYIEDFDFLGDRGYTQGVDFDLNEQNVRWCVTPEFPAGTYAYFTTINADGTPAYPYTTGRQYYGNPTGGTTTIGEAVTTFFDGGSNKIETSKQPAVNTVSGNVTVTWSAVEGGTYLVEASDDLKTWPDLTPAVTATDDVAAFTETGAKNSHSNRFYRMSRTSLASFDSYGFDYTASGGGTTTAVAPGGSAARGTTVTVTITLPTTPPNPPANLVPTTITLGGTITGTSISRPSATTAQATFVIPANATTGAQNVVVTFTPAPSYTLTGGFTIN
ncbi:MAG: YHYH protein [Luteolibacter sp.]|uniref:YHYH protein n=1 Tax=Luteolibacter sp. TaxID=1962973 RepID=UPI0032644994